MLKRESDWLEVAKIVVTEIDSACSNLNQRDEDKGELILFASSAIPSVFWMGQKFQLSRFFVRKYTLVKKGEG